jgi:hypothetical protein
MRIQRADHSAIKCGIWRSRRVDSILSFLKPAFAHETSHFLLPVRIEPVGFNSGCNRNTALSVQPCQAEHQMSETKPPNFVFTFNMDIFVGIRMLEKLSAPLSIRVRVKGGLKPNSVCRRPGLWLRLMRSDGGDAR